MLKNVMSSLWSWLVDSKESLINCLVFLIGVLGVSYLFFYVKSSPISVMLFALFAIIIIRALGCMALGKYFFDLREL